MDLLSSPRTEHEESPSVAANAPSPEAAPARSPAVNQRVAGLIPALNEERQIANVVRRLRAAVPGIDVVVIDDGSSDATAREARDAGAYVLSHATNMGYGIALQTGYKWALRGGYSAAIQVDADGQHDVSDARQLLSPVLAGETDVCLGSRFLPHPQAAPNSSPYRAGLVRRLGMTLFAIIASLATGKRFTDATSGYQALSAAVLKLFTDDRYPFDYPDADQIITLHRAGFRIQEVPVRMHPNEEGRSMHSGLLRPIYYVLTMLLAVFIALIREPIPRPATEAAKMTPEPAATSAASPKELP